MGPECYRVGKVINNVSKSCCNECETVSHVL